jgi:glycosidase
MHRSPLLAIALATLPVLPMASSGCFRVDDVSARTVPLESHVADWRDEIIYQVLVDRFADGTPSNNWRVDRSSLARYQGGDWQGLIEHLDYFQALGVTTLWISPIVRNIETDAGIDGYHGYWASDLAELNPHFGDLATLRRLVREAHARNIHIVVDIVTNHMGQMFYYDINQNGRPDDNLYGGGMNSGFQNPGGTSSPLQRVSEYDPDYNTRGVIQSFTSLGPAGPAPVIFLNMPDIFRTPPRADRACDPNISLEDQPECNSWQAILARPEGYHRRGRIVSYDNFNHQPGEQVLMGDFPGGLKDVNTENPAVRAAMIQAYARWVELTDIDGFRIDTLKHVEHEFWREFARGVRERLARRGKTRFFMFGEAFDGDDELIGSYTRRDEMDSVFYFSQKFRVYRDVFQCESPTASIESLYNTERPQHFGTEAQPSGAGAPPTQLLVNFFDNHDVPRFLAGIFDEDPNTCRPGRVTNDDEFANMRRKMHAALVYMFTQDGLPCVYYGTEQDFRGANDPSNREVLWERARDFALNGDAARDFPTDGETFRHIARLARIRRAYEPLRRGGFQFRWTSMATGNAQDAGILAFERRTPTAGVLVVINAHSAGASETANGGNQMQTGFSAGTELVDVLGTSGASYRVGDGGRLTVRLEPWQSVILVPRDAVQSLPQ